MTGSSWRLENNKHHICLSIIYKVLQMCITGLTCSLLLPISIPKGVSGTRKWAVEVLILQEAPDPFWKVWALKGGLGIVKDWTGLLLHWEGKQKPGGKELLWASLLYLSHNRLCGFQGENGRQKKWRTADANAGKTVIIFHLNLAISPLCRLQSLIIKALLLKYFPLSLISSPNGLQKNPWKAERNVF